jgi:hypothetical protein
MSLVFVASVFTQSAKSIGVDVSKEKVGAESSKFLSVVGNWMISMISWSARQTVKFINRACQQSIKRG